MKKICIPLIVLGFVQQALGFVAQSGCGEADYILMQGQVTIATQGVSYVPKCVKVKVGSQVTIQASHHHPLAAGPVIAPVATAHPFANQQDFMSSQTRQMDSLGQFGFFCSAHGDSEGDGMAGSILVVQ